MNQGANAQVAGGLQEEKATTAVVPDLQWE